MEKLKPCPFYDGEATYIEVINHTAYPERIAAIAAATYTRSDEMSNALSAAMPN